MACECPIWIRNRRYYDKKRPRVGFSVDADHNKGKSNCRTRGYKYEAN